LRAIDQVSGDQSQAPSPEFLVLAPRIPIRPSTEHFRWAQANIALGRLREGTVQGAVVWYRDVVVMSASALLHAVGLHWLLRRR
jgi:hypothetical protein